MVKDSGSGQPDDSGAYLRPATGPGANEGTVYCVAGSSGWINGRYGYHPVMYFDETEMGSVVLDINSNQLDAVFLRETGVIDDSFTIIHERQMARVPYYQLRSGEWENHCRWNSFPGRLYQIERANNFESAPWVPVSSTITASSETTSWTNAVPIATSSFYRLVWLQN